MNRLAWLVCGIVLLMSPNALVAQHRGGRGAGAGRSPAGTSNTDDLKDFKRAVALQATPEQLMQFHELTRTTQAARKGAEDLRELAGKVSPPKLFDNVHPLTNAVAEAQNNNEQFLRSFSEVQKSYLKSELKKLGKANSEVAKQTAAFNRRLERPRLASKQIADVVGKLDKALIDLQTRQLGVGSEMGIRDEGNS